MEHEERGSPRLVIREMVLENFKSYAGTQRVGPFHKVYNMLLCVSIISCQQTASPCIHTFSNHHSVPSIYLSQNFSSVVGPNGSGKSNVIDAMLFVFGKRAAQLRLRKVSELIHNSTHHRNLQLAKVSVVFQEIVDVVSASIKRTEGLFVVL